MLRNLFLLILLILPLSSCTSLDEINEKAKGDGFPYIPGI